MFCKLLTLFSPANDPGNVAVPLLPHQRVHHSALTLGLALRRLLLLELAPHHVQPLARLLMVACYGLNLSF